MNLRELRLWHWKQWMWYRTSQNAFPYGSMNWKFYEMLITVHVKAVQCLNDHVSGTAEQDSLLTTLSCMKCWRTPQEARDGTKPGCDNCTMIAHACGPVAS